MISCKLLGPNDLNFFPPRNNGTVCLKAKTPGIQKLHGIVKYSRNCGLCKCIVNTDDQVQCGGAVEALHLVFRMCFIEVVPSQIDARLCGNDNFQALPLLSPRYTLSPSWHYIPI